MSVRTKKCGELLGKAPPEVAAREIELGSRWIVNGVGGSGNVYEAIERREGDHPCDYRVRLVELGVKTDPRWSVGDEFTVDREWFDIRAREVSP